MVREMLSVLMDGLKDANMLIDYCEDCSEPTHKNWFMNHAKKRYEELLSDYEYIKQQTGLIQKIHDGDAIAEALDGHIQHEMLELKKRMY